MMSIVTPGRRSGSRQPPDVGHTKANHPSQTALLYRFFPGVLRSFFDLFERHRACYSGLSGDSDSDPRDTEMATVAPKALPHIHALLTTPSQTEERSPTPVALSPSQTYWGDRRGLLFWFACASLL